MSDWLGSICVLVRLSMNGLVLLDFSSYVFVIIYAWLCLIRVCAVRSEEGMVACLHVLCRPGQYPWARQALPRAGSLAPTVLRAFLCRLAEGCGSPVNWKGTPVTTQVSQAESLTPSCCLNPFPNSQWSCEALNPTDFSGCGVLQNFKRACSMSQWSWADCMRMRHLAGSPPERRTESWQSFPQLHREESWRLSEFAAVLAHHWKGWSETGGIRLWTGIPNRRTAQS